MTVETGIAASLLSPLLEAVGFLEWDIHWSKAGGSAFALNMYKCNFAAFLFLCMAVYDSNEPFLIYTNELSSVHNQPYGYTSNIEQKLRMEMNPFESNVNVESMMQQTQPLIQQQPFDQQQQQQQQIPLQQVPANTPPQQQIENIPPPEQQQLQQQSEQLMNQMNSNPTVNRRLQESGEQPVDARDYVILERRKKTPYDENDVNMNEVGMDNQYFPRVKTLPPYPENYRRPFDGQRYQIFYIILSSFLGIVIGDMAELEALRLIGARRVLVVDTVKPFAAAILGNILLDESIYPAAFLGMILTALGVYIVLMASLEKVEQIKEKKRQGNLKRRGDLPFNDDYSSGGISATSEETYGEDEEIMSIMNEERKKIKFVGMHRRPLSRHDLRADLEELLGDEDELMMLLEDGRGYGINPTIFCTLDGSSSRSGDRSWSSKHSVLSFTSMGSLEDLNLDVHVAMENFDNDDNDDDDFFFCDNHPESPPLNHIYDEEVKDYFNHKDKVEEEAPSQEISFPSKIITPVKPLKSVLKKNSRFQLKEKDVNTPTTPAKNEESPKPDEIIQKDSNESMEKQLPLNAETTKRNRSRLQSQSSFVSIDTECGPPPGLYGTDVWRETKVQRAIRLRTGYFLALLNVILDAYGAFLTKRHGYGMSTWEINLCRLGFAGCLMLSLSLAMKFRDFRRKSKRKPFQSDHSPIQYRPWYRLPKMKATSWIVVSLGVCFVTFFAPALANYSLFEIPLALSVSLCSVTPLYTLPLGILMKGERPSKRGYQGAALSVLGVMILCIWGLDAESL